MVALAGQIRDECQDLYLIIHGRLSEPKNRGKTRTKSLKVKVSRKSNQCASQCVAPHLHTTITDKFSCPTPSEVERQVRFMQHTPSPPPAIHHHVNIKTAPTSPSPPNSIYDQDDTDASLLNRKKGKGKARAVDHPSNTPNLAASDGSFASDTVTSNDQLQDDGSRSTRSIVAAEEFEDESEMEADQDQDAIWCLICHTSPIRDRTVLPNCLHSQFCFECICRWATIKRTCPLCLANIGEYVIHGIRDDDDYLRFHLPPPPPPLASSLSTQAHSSGGTSTAAGTGASAGAASGSWLTERRRIVRQVQTARAQRRDSSNHYHHQHGSTVSEQQSLERRKHIYRHHLYACHVGSNRHTGYKPCPSPAQIRHSVTTGGGGGDLGRRISSFVRRDLSCLGPDLDTDFLTKYIVSLLQVFAVSADETVKLVGEFLGEHVARHLLHELECWLRSGKSELRFYDSSPFLQYPASAKDAEGERIARGKGKRRRRGRNEGEEDEARGGGGGGVGGVEQQRETGSSSNPTSEAGSADMSNLGEEQGGDGSDGSARREYVALMRRKFLLERVEKERGLLHSCSSSSSSSSGNKTE